MCSDAASFDLTGANLGAAIQEVLAAVEVALVRRDNEGQTDAQVTHTLASDFVAALSPCQTHAGWGGKAIATECVQPVRMLMLMLMH